MTDVAHEEHAHANHRVREDRDTVVPLATGARATPIASHGVTDPARRYLSFLKTPTGTGSRPVGAFETTAEEEIHSR